MRTARRRNADVCEIRAVNRAKVDAVKRRMPCKEDLLRLAGVFGAMASLSRIKILYALSRGEMCVCEITELLGISQSGVSHQLRRLRELGIVKYRKEGKIVYYSLSDGHVRTLFGQALSHLGCGRKKRRPHGHPSTGSGSRAESRDSRGTSP